MQNYIINDDYTLVQKIKHKIKVIKKERKKEEEKEEEKIKI